MIKGTVKWFDIKKGFGFIGREDVNKDVFVHIKDLEATGIRNLQENQSVSFEIVVSKGKEKAVNVNLA